MSKFNIGDVVMLKSGGPKMTVSDTKTYSYFDGSVQPFNGMIETTWFEGTKVVNGSFNQETLMII